jgi:glycosyltransferase involved in cell wall biosynthesis
MNRKTIFFIISRFPYPINSGQNVRIFNLLKRLSEKFEINLLVIDAKPDQSYLNYFINTTHISNILFFPISKNIRILNIIFSIIKLEPIQVGYYKSSELIKFLNKNNYYDVAIFHLIRTSQYRVQKDYKIPAVLEMCDALSSNYKQSFKILNFYNPWKWISLYEYLTLISFERKEIRKFNIVSLHSLRDSFNFNLKDIKLLISKQGTTINARSEIIKNTILNRKKILFIGKLDFQPNLNGILWFINSVLPKLPDDISIKIIGAGVKSLLKHITDFSRIEVCDFVPNLVENTNDCFCAIAPIFISTGTQTKVIDYFNLEIPVIMTNKVSEGFDPLILNFTFVPESSSDWVHAILNIYLSPSKYDEYIKNAKQYVIENHNWDSIGNSYFEAIDNVIGN